MKSKAAIADHPIHPLLVTIPVATFALVLVGDIASIITRDPYWYRFSFDCLTVGILSALLAATFGLIDYVTVKMSVAGDEAATARAPLRTADSCIPRLKPRFGRVTRSLAVAQYLKSVPAGALAYFNLSQRVVRKGPLRLVAETASSMHRNACSIEPSSCRPSTFNFSPEPGSSCTETALEKCSCL
jgi:hypothetical protein